MRETSFTESKNSASGVAVTARAVNWERWGILYARWTLGAAFLSGIADRFGWYTGRNVGYGDFAGFVSYTAKVNSFMPAYSIPYLAWAATAAELFFGRRVDIGSVAAMGGVGKRAVAGVVWNCDGDFVWDQVADGLFGVFGIGGSGFARVLWGSQGSCASLSGIG